MLITKFKSRKSNKDIIIASPYVTVCNAVKITSKMRTKAEIQAQIIFDTIATKIDRSNDQRNLRRSKR